MTLQITLSSSGRVGLMIIIKLCAIVKTGRNFLVCVEGKLSNEEFPS